MMNFKLSESFSAEYNHVRGTVLVQKNGRAVFEIAEKNSVSLSWKEATDELTKLAYRCEEMNLYEILSSMYAQEKEIQELKKQRRGTK